MGSIDPETESALMFPRDPIELVVRRVLKDHP
jgi:hypothetical protein